jgi:hypothetical protein
MRRTERGRRGRARAHAGPLGRRATQALAAALVLLAHAAGAIEALDRVDQALRWQTADGSARVALSGRLDVETYWIDQRPPGLVFGDDGPFANTRLVLLLDAWLGKHLYAFVQARADRGFDPRLVPDGDARADEYLVRWTPLASPALNLQLGKFATLVGNWVLRHDSWQNPFVTAPLPYERVTTVSDDAAPDSPAAFRARRDLADKKRKWLPVVWGPSYASGASAFGRTDALEYGIEVKNAALGSRPSEWDGTERDWSEPTVSGRIGLRPSPAWAVGVSASTGPYLRHDAERSLRPGDDTADFRETVLAADARWSWRHLELWSEIFAARFEVPFACRRCTPHSEDADSLAWYVEGRYRVTPSLFAALRWNQQVFADVESPGGDVASDRDAWRTDMALTYRFDRHVQAKLQYAIGRQTGSVQQGEQLVAAQLTIRF